MKQKMNNFFFIKAYYIYTDCYSFYCLMPNMVCNNPTLQIIQHIFIVCNAFRRKKMIKKSFFFEDVTQICKFITFLRLWLAMMCKHFIIALNQSQSIALLIALLNYSITHCVSVMGGFWFLLSYFLNLTA